MATADTTTTTSFSDPFASQETNALNSSTIDDIPRSSSDAPRSSQDRRFSKEWDASKVPPSRFQKPEGSVYATPSSRDGRIKTGKERDATYFEKLKEPDTSVWERLKEKRRESKKK